MAKAQAVKLENGIQHYMLKCMYDRKKYQTCIFLIDHWFPLCYRIGHFLVVKGISIDLYTTFTALLIELSNREHG